MEALAPSLLCKQKACTVLRWCPKCLQCADAHCHVGSTPGERDAIFYGPENDYSRTETKCRVEWRGVSGGQGWHYLEDGVKGCLPRFENIPGKDPGLIEEPVEEGSLRDILTHCEEVRQDESMKKHGTKHATVEELAKIGGTAENEATTAWRGSGTF